MLYKTICVLLSGKLGSGKSTLAAQLLEEFTILKYNTIITSFATPIKIIARDFIGWKGEKDEKGRKLLQLLGTEVGREYSEDCWVDWVFNKYLPKQINYPFDIIIIDDWRFPNEASYVYNLGLYDTFKIRIIRNLDTSKKEYFHTSEISLPDNLPGYYDLIYFNKYSIDNMRLDAKNIVNIILSEYEKEKK